MNHILYHRKKQRKYFLPAICLVILALGIALSFYIFTQAQTIPSIDTVLKMDDETAGRALKGYEKSRICEVWGDPCYIIDAAYSNNPGKYCCVYKEADGLDHAKIWFDNESDRITSVEVIYVFKAYPVYSNSDGSRGTVRPSKDEDEAKLGDLIRINFRTSRQAVLDCLDPFVPVIVYYKGMPSEDAPGELPYIDTVIDMQYYDNMLEPPMPDGEGS